MTENLVKITDFLLTLRHVQEIFRSVPVKINLPIKSKVMSFMQAS